MTLNQNVQIKDASIKVVTNLNGKPFVIFLMTFGSLSTTTALNIPSLAIKLELKKKK